MALLSPNLVNTSPHFADIKGIPILELESTTDTCTSKCNVVYQ